MPLNTHTMERLVPDFVQSGDVTGEETLQLHFERYEFAVQHVQAGRLLDISCGVGYGTDLLVRQCDQITSAIGVDLDDDAINYAQQRYGDDRIEFLAADAFEFQPENGLNTIVSLETIEHLDEPARFVQRIAGFLKPGGVFIASAPTTPSVDANPHHKTDFSEATFRRLFTAIGLAEIDCCRQIQPFSPAPLLARTEARAKNLRRNLPLYYITHPASLFRRFASTVRYGFTNRYLTVVWRMQHV